MRRSALLVSAILLGALTGFSAAQNAGLPANAPPLAVSPQPAPAPNLPFTADVVTRFERTLGGQNVVRETQGRVMRDNQGRVRIETPLPNSNTLKRITIHDAMLHELITLDARTNTATVVHISPTTGAKPSASAVAGPSGSTVVAQNAAGSSTTIHMNGRPMSSAMVSASTSTSSLGTKTMDGVQVEGKRTTRTAPDGMGSEAAQSVSETWYSPELKITMSSETNDGPRGRSSMRVTNLVRSEPAPELFQIPADYTIKEVGQGAAGSQP